MFSAGCYTQQTFLFSCKIRGWGHDKIEPVNLSSFKQPTPLSAGLFHIYTVNILPFFLSLYDQRITSSFNGNGFIKQFFFVVVVVENIARFFSYLIL
jgi:hypothetical protein